MAINNVGPIELCLAKTETGEFAVRAPKANAYCERLVGTVRRECLDFMIRLNERHLRRSLQCWITHYNLGCLIQQVRKVFSDRGLNIPDSGFLDFAVRAGLHNFQILVAAGNEKDSPENRDRFCTDFILQFVIQPERSYL